MRCFSIAVLMLVAVASVGPMWADGEEARALLDEVRNLNQTTRHWDDRQQRLELTIVDRRGGERDRALEMWTKQYDDDASRTLLFFREPAEARGVGFLQWVDPHGPDRQWLYLPALKRVRQITGSRKGESFVGTDFSFEDVGLMVDALNWTEEDATSRMLGEELVDGVRCAIIALRPNERQEVSYSVVRVWIGRPDKIVRRFEFEDASGRRAKVLNLSEIRQVGSIPVAHRLRMENVRSGSHTIARVVELKFDGGISDRMFTERRLERGG
jgi:hypothetical protein